MNSRQKGILLHLVAAGEAVTSEQLARELGVSSRTIKTDMSAMAPELADNGVELLSRRNRGYSLKIVDEDRFRKFYNVLSLEFGASLPTDEEGWWTSWRRACTSAAEGSGSRFRPPCAFARASA